MSRQPSKELKFSLKDLSEDGSFSGLASVYGNLDLGGDIVEPGAFTKTIKDRNGERTILWQHDAKSPIGKGQLIDGPDGLMIRGKLALGMSQAKDAYEAIKAGIVDGLSIGYDVVKREFKDNARILKELKLWEVSIVTFPMNELSRIQTVKSTDEFITKFSDFAEELKAGRRLSAETISRLQTAMTGLSALLATSEEAGDAAAKSRLSEPDLHSLMNFIKEF